MADEEKDVADQIDDEAEGHDDDPGTPWPTPLDPGDPGGGG